MGPVPATPNDWGEVLKIYGVAAPLLLALLVAMKVVWNKYNESQAENKALTVSMIDKVIPLVTESNTQLKEAVEVIRSSKDNQKTFERMVETLERLEPKLDALNRQISRPIRAE